MHRSGKIAVAVTILMLVVLLVKHSTPSLISRAQEIVHMPPLGWNDPSPSQIHQLQQVLLDQINRDRKAHGIKPVVWDPVAAAAAQQHVKEEADAGYISHWGINGFKPQLRYTMVGGLDAVQENESVSLFESSFLGMPYEDIQKEILKHQTLMMAEPAGDDGHKQNILNPHHTGVGVAIAVGKHGIAMAEEFTNHYTVMKPLPKTSSPGSTVTLSGKLLPAVKLAYVLATYEEAPRPMTLAEIKETHSYSDPPIENTHFWGGPGLSKMYLDTVKGKLTGHDITSSGTGFIAAAIPLSVMPGLDYITVYVKSVNGEPFPAFQWVIQVQ